jgi:hypothetical protein
MEKFLGAYVPDRPDLEVRVILKKAIASSSKSRKQIADGMSEKLCRSVSVRMLNDYTAPTKGSRFPAAWVAAFCEMTGSDELQRWLLSPHFLALVELGKSVLTAECQKRIESRIVDSLLSGREHPSI